MACDGHAIALSGGVEKTVSFFRGVGPSSMDDRKEDDKEENDDKRLPSCASLPWHWQGAGKSTVLSLIQRFYDVTGGRNLGIHPSSSDSTSFSSSTPVAILARERMHRDCEASERRLRARWVLRLGSGRGARVRSGEIFYSDLEVGVGAMPGCWSYTCFPNDPVCVLLLGGLGRLVFGSAVYVLLRLPLTPHPCS